METNSSFATRLLFLQSRHEGKCCLQRIGCACVAKIDTTIPEVVTIFIVGVINLGKATILFDPRSSDEGEAMRTKCKLQGIESTILRSVRDEGHQLLACLPSLTSQLFSVNATVVSAPLVCTLSSPLPEPIPHLGELLSPLRRNGPAEIIRAKSLTCPDSPCQTTFYPHVH